MNRAERQRNAQRVWYAAHREEKKAKSRAWNEAHPERRAEVKREYRARLRAALHREVVDMQIAMFWMDAEGRQQPFLLPPGAEVQMQMLWVRANGDRLPVVLPEGAQQFGAQMQWVPIPIPFLGNPN